MPKEEAQMERLIAYALICLGALLSLASCGNNGNGTGPELSPEPSPWEACAVGQILAAGTDPCTYPGRNEVLSVNEAGEMCIDDDCGQKGSGTGTFWGLSITSNGKTVLIIHAEKLDDGRYAITRLGNKTRTVREILQEAGELSEPVVCYVGLTLGPGESCRHDDGTSFFMFEVRSNGSSCVLGFCGSGDVFINDFHAKANGDNTWTITRLP